MKAVHFGAGNIGRGFLGQLYYESGYETTFVDVVPEIVAELQRRREYPLRLVADTTQTIVIKNVTAVDGADRQAVASALAQADLASTAVGVNVLERIAPAIADGIALRARLEPPRPLNIIVCENLIDAGPYLRGHVRRHLSPDFHAFLETHVGFVEASIGRMVPLMTPEMKAGDPLLVCVEPYCELPVDAQGFRGPVPPLAHMMPCGRFKAYVERKLFVHNAGHAATAYLGYLRGHQYLWQAIADTKIAAVADAAMAESCAGLSAKHGMSAAELAAHWQDLRRRFANRALADQVVRVAADPVRKLGPNDRLVGAAAMCLEQGIEPANLAFAAAAAIHYDHPADPAAQHVQQIRRESGLTGVLEQVCHIAAQSPLARLIERGEQRLHDEGWTG